MVRHVLILLLAACTQEKDDELTPPDTGVLSDPCPVAVVGPMALTWSNLRIGEHAEADVIIANECSGVRDLSVRATVDSGFDVTQDADLAPPGGAVTVTVGVTLADYLPLEGLLLLATDDPAAPEIVVPLSASAAADQDADGWPVEEDCDDTDAAVYPGAPDAWYDGIDSDCAGDDDDDQDADGYALDDDCDDTDAAVYPGATEVCDGVMDEDCDGEVDEVGARGGSTVYPDADGDGFGDPSLPTSVCEAVSGYTPDDTDCDDADAASYPGAEDVCDGADNDCDGLADAGWGVPADYPTIGDAISAATGGEHICVAAGTWEEEIDFSGKDIVVESMEGAEATTIQGDGTGSVVTLENGEGPGAQLIGFTITGGGGGGGGGGGIYLADASPTLTDLIVSGNDVYETYGCSGGGILVVRGSPELVRVEVSDNTLDSVTESVYGAGIYAYSATLWLTDVRIVGNRASSGYNGDTVGVGLSLLGGTAYARRLEVIGNTGSEVPVNAGMGIGLRGADLIGTNVVVAGNRSDDGLGAGIYVSAGHLGLRNATIVGNDSGADATAAGGVYLDDASATLWNLVLTDNTGAETDGLTAAGASDVTFRYDDLYGNGSDDLEGVDDPVGADGNIAVAPGFTDTSSTDPEDWDLSLAAGSALVDAGDPEILDPDGTCSDIGAWGGPDASAGVEGAGCVAVDWYPDADRDGFGVVTSAISACAWPGPGWGRSDEDCDDTDATVHPLAEETCNDVDEDCDGTVDPDDCTSSLGDAGGSWTGEELGDNVGEALAVLGDIDGDGIDDIGIASYDHAGSSRLIGKVWVASGLVSGPTSLASAIASIEGEESYDRLGQALSAAGDVDADGYGDLWVSSIRSSAGGSGQGAAWLFNGPLTGDVLLSDAALLVYATSSTTNLGSSIVGDLDADGDGDLDLMIGASGALSNDGAVLLFLDGPSGTGTLSAAVADAMLTGEGDAGGAGDRGAAGDVDGDGVADLLVAAPNQDTTTLRSAGVVYVLTHTPSGTEALADADGRFTGTKVSAYAGESLAYAEDVDGDGLGDVLVGQVWGGSSGEGAVWLIPGPATGDTGLDSIASAQIVGEAATDALGFAVAAPGDVDGDGHADFAAGAYSENTAGTEAGAVYRFFGPVSGALTGADAADILYGEAASDRAGRALAAGDVDGDGTPELLVGAPDRSAVLGSDGEVYIVAW